MKLISVSIIVFCLGILGYLWLESNPFTGERGKKSEVRIPVHEEHLRNHVKALTGTALPRNAANIASLNEAAEYIRDMFTEAGLDVEEQRYKVNGIEYRNIIASFGPIDADRIIIGAHYDVCGDQPGADDNASGVAGLLEIARLLPELRHSFKHRIDLVAYTLEEPPYFRTEHMGSTVHAKSLYDSKVNVHAMICLEMIGYFSDKPGSQRYPLKEMEKSYPDKGNYIAVVGKTGQTGLVRRIKNAMNEASDLPVESINAPVEIPGIDFSDHQSYWKYGYDAVMITNTSFYRNDNYHKPGDTPETLDYNRMAEVVKGVYNAIVEMQ